MPTAIDIQSIVQKYKEITPGHIEMDAEPVEKAAKELINDARVIYQQEKNLTSDQCQQLFHRLFEEKYRLMFQGNKNELKFTAIRILGRTQDGLNLSRFLFKAL